jgi:WhiB family transcriptional regulator, redox-sensing transcriptional regulator
VWRHRALCQYVDASVFFPEKGQTAREAKRVCNRCPVTVECLDWALERKEPTGIYGGTTAGERVKLLK